MTNENNMAARVQSINLGGKRFVVLERSEYDRLRTLERATAEARLPAFPPADLQGNRPALEFLQVSIARDIINERQALGLTQVQLAKLAGIRQETLCRLETGKTAPNVRTVEKIDHALKQAAKPAKQTRKKGK